MRRSQKCGATTVWESRRKGCLRWQCKACQKDFSLTSGTLFASRKMPLRSYLMAIAIFFAILYSIARAAAQVVLAPIHEKLDRLLALQEQAVTPPVATRDRAIGPSVES